MTMTFLAVFLFLLAVGGVLVAYGTAVRNKWGINLDPVSCPRCGTPLPKLYVTRSLRQHMWGGWTCPACGAGVDKWGREIAPIAPPTVVMPEVEVRRVIRRRFFLSLPVIFCVFLLLDWTGITDGGFPTTWGDALVQIIENLVYLVVLGLPLYFIFTRGRLRAGRGPDHAARSEPEPKRGA